MIELWSGLIRFIAFAGTSTCISMLQTHKLMGRGEEERGDRGEEGEGGGKERRRGEEGSQGYKEC